MGDIIKRLAVLGSTGSIGQQTLDVARTLPHRFQVVGLAAGKNIDLLAKQIEEFKPAFAYCSPADGQDREILSRLTNTEYELLSLEDIASHPQVDVVVMATSG